VTGGSRGFGRTIASTFVASGANVLIAARSKDEVEGAAAALSRQKLKSSQHVEGRVLDLCAENAIETMFAGFWDKTDILINNAGSQGPISPLWENELVDWQAAFQVNLFVPVAMMKRVIPGMISRGYGRIVNISGGGATAPRPNFSAYGAAKTALVRATENVAVELAGTGVTANAIAPGAMYTAMTRGILEAGVAVAGQKEVEATLRLLDSNDPPGGKAAELCVYLATDAAAEVSGRLIAALWDPWPEFGKLAAEMASSDVYTLRRILPKDRGHNWE
jgi:NAD(P)-dependent dehydrogenase (short-subunit alcohol dehydrogenase family)